MKSFLLKSVLVLVLISFTSCSSDDDTTDNSAEVNQVVGEWQMYRTENLEAVIDQWTGTEWTYVDQWFKNVWEDSEILITFNNDGTFTEFYATVETANGTWEKLEDGRYSYNYTLEVDNTNEVLVGTRLITVHCDNTFSVITEGDDRNVAYYRTRNTTECSDLITYNLE